MVNKDNSIILKELIVLTKLDRVLVAKLQGKKKEMGNNTSPMISTVKALNLHS